MEDIMEKIIYKIQTNKIKCKKCGDIIESKSTNDYKRCSCGAVAVDGGRDYLKRIGNEEIVYDNRGSCRKRPFYGAGSERSGSESGRSRGTVYSHLRYFRRRCSV